MRWKPLDSDCRTSMLAVIRAGLDEPRKYGFSHFFGFVDEYLNVTDKLSKPLVDILMQAKCINKDSKELVEEINEIYDKFKKLDF